MTAIFSKVGYFCKHLVKLMLLARNGFMSSGDAAFTSTHSCMNRPHLDAQGGTA